MNSNDAALTSIELEDQPVHDQLPSVEEVKQIQNAMSPSTDRRPSLNKKHIAFMSLLFLALFAILVGVAIMIGKAHRDEKSELHQILSYLSQHSETSALYDHTTPQRRAADWMAFTDTLTKGVPKSSDDWKFLQRYALMTLYFATGGDATWSDPLHFASPRRHECNWFRSMTLDGATNYTTNGVTCNQQDQVERLETDYNALAGSLPSEVALLRHLKHLSLAGNAITGTLPHAFKKLAPHLEHFSLASNNIIGSIPTWLGDFTSLTALDFSSNHFTSTLPEELQGLTSVETLSLSTNHLHGNVTFVERMTSLRNIRLDDNKFTGKITNDFFSETRDKLKVLDISSNNFHGKVPRSLLHASHLETLNLADNELDGSLPAVTASSTLKYLSIANNFLTGSIPPSIKNIDKLRSLDLAVNRLEGEIPSTLGELNQLTVLSLGENQGLTAGSIPDFMTSMTKLRELNMRHTSRTGDLPTELGKLTDLVLLDLSDNGILGPVCSELGKLTDLEFLLLSRNELTGNLPIEIAQLTSLDLLAIDNNIITGNASHVCSALDIQEFSADCGGNSKEIDCPCCNYCCEDGDIQQTCPDSDDLLAMFETSKLWL